MKIPKRNISNQTTRTAGNSGQPVLSGYGKNFPKQISLHLAYMRTCLRLTEAELDYSLISLDKIEQAVKEKKIPNNTASPDRKLLDGIVAYCGEVIRHQVRGRWKMIRLKSGSGKDQGSGRLFMPAVEDPQGRVLLFWGLVAELMEEPQEWPFRLQIQYYLENPDVIRSEDANDRNMPELPF